MTKKRNHQIVSNESVGYFVLALVALRKLLRSNIQHSKVHYQCYCELHYKNEHYTFKFEYNICGKSCGSPAYRDICQEDQDFKFIFLMLISTFASSLFFTSL